MKRGKIAFICILIAAVTSILLLRRQKIRTEQIQKPAQEALFTDRINHKQQISATDPKGGVEDKKIDDLISKSKIEARDCQKKLQSLQEKLNSSKNSNLVETLQELRSIPGVPASSAAVFTMIQQNSAKPWKFGEDVHQLGDCNLSLRTDLMKNIINRAIKLNAQEQKTVVSLVIENLRAVSSEPAPLLVQLASASTLSTLQQSGLLGEDLSLSDEVAVIRDEYRNFSNSVSAQEDTFKVTQLEMDYSERARSRVLSIIEARFPTK